MTRRFVFGVLVALVLVAGAVTVGAFAYRAGVMQGALQNPVIVAPDGGLPEGGVPVPYYYHGGPGYWRGGWGWGGGFGFLQCLIPFFFIFLLFGLLRMAFGHRWGWRRGWGGPGGPGRMGWDSEKGYPPMFEEWHRKMHEGGATPQGGQTPQAE